MKSITEIIESKWAKRKEEAEEKIKTLVDGLDCKRFHLRNKILIVGGNNDDEEKVVYFNDMEIGTIEWPGEMDGLKELFSDASMSRWVTIWDNSYLKDEKDKIEYDDPISKQKVYLTYKNKKASSFLRGILFIIETSSSSESS